MGFWVYIQVLTTQEQVMSGWMLNHEGLRNYSRWFLQILLIGNEPTKIIQSKFIKINIMPFILIMKIMPYRSYYLGLYLVIVKWKRNLYLRVFVCVYMCIYIYVYIYIYIYIYIERERD
jgi:hypothetical protein